MGLRTVSFRLPEELIDAVGSKDEVETKAVESFLLTLVKEGKITASYAAEVLHYSYKKMLELMTAYDIPIVRYSPEQFEKEIESLEKLIR